MHAANSLVVCTHWASGDIIASWVNLSWIKDCKWWVYLYLIMFFLTTTRSDSVGTDKGRERCLSLSFTVPEYKVGAKLSPSQCHQASYGSTGGELCECVYSFNVCYICITGFKLFLIWNLMCFELIPIKKCNCKVQKGGRALKWRESTRPRQSEKGCAISGQVFILVKTFLSVFFCSVMHPFPWTG